MTTPSPTNGPPTEKDIELLSNQHTVEKPRITKWSPSALDHFEACPYRLWLRRIAKVKPPEVDSEDTTHPLVRGTLIHKYAEQYVKGEADALNPALRKLKTEFEDLRSKYEARLVQVEQEWGINTLWAPTTWSASDCWGMLKCDAVVYDPESKIVTIIDYKTGKRFGNEVKHNNQMTAYAMGGFSYYPAAKLVNTQLWYTDEGKITSKNFTPPQRDVFIPRVERRAYALTQAVAFPPKPNRRNCKFCDYGVTNGNGACPYAVADT